MCVYIYTHIHIYMCMHICVYIYVCVHTHIYIFCCCMMDGAAIYIHLRFCDIPVSVLERALLPSTVLNEQWKTCTGFCKGKSAVPTAFYAFSYPCLTA